MKLLDDLYCYPWENLMVNNCNSYFIDGKVRTLIDAGLQDHLKSLLSRMEEDGINGENIDLIISTHSHSDHFEGNQSFIHKKTKMALHKEEEKFIEGVGKEIYSMFGMKKPKYRVDFYLKEGELNLGEKSFQIYHTPGHSPGSISLYWLERKVLITGDVIFYQGVGRTDFPGGNGNLLKKSIERLSELEVEYLLPGHGDIVSGKEVIKQNFIDVKRAYFSYL
jgi:glyoxylase-like metal-dependent hydrolase (beta-lactamase superfamily II)